MTAEFYYIPEHEDLTKLVNVLDEAIRDRWSLGSTFTEAQGAVNSISAVSDRYIYVSGTKCVKIDYEEVVDVDDESHVRKYVTGYSIGYKPMINPMVESAKNWFKENANIIIPAVLASYILGYKAGKHNK